MLGAHVYSDAFYQDLASLTALAPVDVTREAMQCILLYHPWTQPWNAVFASKVKGAIQHRGSTAVSVLELVGVWVFEEWSGKFCARLTNPRMNMIQDLSVLPPDVELQALIPQPAREFSRRYDKNAGRQITDNRQYDTSVFARFVRHMIGCSTTNHLGKLTILDLRCRIQQTQNVDIPFAVLSTLLPLARTLVELRVDIITTSDFLWLTYAMTHPTTQQAKWRSLMVRRVRDRLDIDAVQKMILAKDPILVLLDAVGGADLDVGTRVSQWRAKTSKATTVLKTLDGHKQYELTKGEAVDVCDLAPGGTKVVALVAGAGFGWLDRSHLAGKKAKTKINISKPCMPCVTEVHVVDDLIQPRDYSAFLELFGGRLTRLELTELSWPLSDMFCTLTPQLERLECCEFRPRDLSTLQLSQLACLRMLGLRCRERHLGELGEFLCHSRLKLTKLRLDVTISEQKTVDMLVNQLLPWILVSNACV